MIDKYNCQNKKKSCQNLRGGGLKLPRYRRRQDNMSLRNKLKEYRAKTGLNQSDFGRMVGASRQTISQIERGDYSPSVTLALRIAKLCDAKVEDIFIYEEEQN